MMPSLGTPQQQPADINRFQDGMINVAYNVCSIPSMPVELVIRPLYGSRYFPPLIQLCAAGLMILLPVFSQLAEGFSHMVPFLRFQGAMGLYGIGSISKLFFICSFIHGIRIWRRMLRPLRELHSHYEGPALPIFGLFTRSFWITRIILEPALVFTLALVLSNFFILQPSAAHYLEFASFCLAMKQYIAWYKQWERIRDVLDARSTAPILAKIVDNTATDEDRATIHMASLPKDIPEDLRRDTAVHIARAFSNGQWQEPAIPKQEETKGEPHV
jgi:hypothetical protein